MNRRGITGHSPATVMQEHAPTPGDWQAGAMLPAGSPGDLFRAGGLHGLFLPSRGRGPARKPPLNSELPGTSPWQSRAGRAFPAIRPDANSAGTFPSAGPFIALPFSRVPGCTFHLLETEDAQ